jgi:hypothetical protein
MTIAAKSEGLRPAGPPAEDRDDPDERIRMAKEAGTERRKRLDLIAGPLA